MPRAARTLVTLALLVILAGVVHLGVGSWKWLTPGEVIHELIAGANGKGTNHVIVWDIRLPRCLACIFVGGILGVVGSAFQAYLRNRLAEPYVIGVSSGAAVGGAGSMFLGFGAQWGGLGMIGAGCVTGLASLALVIALSRRNGSVDRGTLLLGGVLVGSLLSSLLSLILLAAGQDTNRVLQWLLGSMTPAFFSKDLVLGIAMVVGTAVLLSQSKKLNALAGGETLAKSVGVNVPRLTQTVLITGTVMTSVAVSSVGIIGFLGLVAPHTARRLVGVDWRWSLPASMLCGSLLLTVSDLVAQRVLGMLTQQVGFDPPVGVVTAILGAPVLLVLLKKRG